MLRGMIRAGRFRPWHDRTGILRWVLGAFLLTAPLGVWWLSGGVSIWRYGFSMPEGQVLYLSSKLAGLYTFVLLSVQILGALGRAGWLPVNPVPRFSAKWHRRLGIMTILLMLLHVGLFVGAVSARMGHFAYSLLLPDFFGGHYKFMVSLGWLGGVLLLGVAVSGFVRTMRDRGDGVHRLAVPILVLVLIHAQQIGSEAGSGVLYYSFMAIGAFVVGSLAVGMIHRLEQRKII